MYILILVHVEVSQSFRNEAKDNELLYLELHLSLSSHITPVNIAHLPTLYSEFNLETLSEKELLAVDVLLKAMKYIKPALEYISVSIVLSIVGSWEK